MFKQIVTLFRGAHVEAGQAFTDANAEALLRQQIRDCTRNLEGARLAVASVMAQVKQEQKLLEKIETQVADLETRAVAALGSGDERLATQAAETIATLEADRDVARNSVAAYEAEVGRMKKALGENERRLAALKRGEKTAKAHSATRKLRNRHGPVNDNTLQDAEYTLSRLRSQHQEATEIETALESLNTSHSADTMREKLALAGHGEPVKSDASQVLERLKAKAVA